MGYDTAGLLKVIQDPTHNPADLLHGFYFDNSFDTDGPSTYTDPITGLANQPIRKTGLYLHGLAEISVSAGVTVSGGLYADISASVNTLDSGNHVALDSIISGLGSNKKVFTLAGKVYASADLSLTIPDPIGPDITLFHYNLAYDELLNFNPPSAQNTGVPTTIVDVTDQHTLLLDVTKMAVGSHVVTVEPFHDFSITTGSTFIGDGIEVDYPNERYLYVEMKDGAASDYYNLIGLSVAIPDAVSIQITDPFRVFLDDEVANPDPTQATPGVVLAGGRNVVYRYTDASDGTHANALMVGGYGSNTLSGGTMEFGNFIPADRMAAAQAHVNVPLGASPSSFDVNAHNSLAAPISAAALPASPSGIIGATMTASRGGLMFGGPGNNSFYSAGAGSYEMDGGAWINTFIISTSFAGGPATYQIDGGPFGQSGLVVRVPANDVATFQNASVPDKYHPEFKALEVLGSFGHSATAHGIQTVHVIAAAGSTVEFGDTSEVNATFSIEGSPRLKFSGTAQSDVFDVDVAGVYVATKDHFTTGDLFTSPVTPGVLLHENPLVPESSQRRFRTQSKGSFPITIYLRVGPIRRTRSSGHSAQTAGCKVSPLACRMPTPAPSHWMARAPQTLTTSNRESAASST